MSPRPGSTIGTTWRTSAILVIALVFASGCGVRASPPIERSDPGGTGTDSSPASQPTESGPPTTTQAEWADVLEQVRPGTVRLEVATCDNERGMGSGFVVGDNLVMTAAHVVDAAGSIALQADGIVTTARVIHFDYAADVALLRTEDELTGRSLVLASEKPRLGTELAVLGFPDWVQDLRVTTGIVSSLDYRLSYSDFTIEEPVMVTDAAINGGNSGGPVIDRTGSVIGLVTGKQILLADLETTSEGTAYVVPSTELDDRLTQWQSDEPAAGQCPDDPEDVEDAPLLEAEYNTDQPDAPEITQVLALHGESINRGDYELAYSLFTNSMQERTGSLEGWSSGLHTSFWIWLAVDEVRRSGDTATVKVRFRTNQEEPYGRDGQTCSDWTQTRRLTLVNDAWLIDSVKNESGSPRACDPSD